jgi:succinyl-CoA synthetase beta subunit
MGEISKVQMENPDLVAMEDVLEETGFSADKLNKILEKLGSKTSLNDLMQGGTSTSTVMEEMSYIAQDGATKIDALASSSEKAA